MGLILGILLIATVVVSLLLWWLAKGTVQELVLQTLAMVAAAFGFFGLIVLLG